MKREFVCLPWSKIPSEQWLKIVFVTPKEYSMVCIPRQVPFILYRAYLTDLGPERVFDIMIPYYMWDRAMRCMGEQIGDLSGPIEFELWKSKHKIKIQNWRYL